MKKYLVIFVFIVIIFKCYSREHINELTNITYDRCLINYDLYNSAIVRYEDRLFLHNQYSIEEIRMLDDGSVEKISIYETKYQGTLYGFIDDNRYYSIRYHSNYNRRLLIFDVSVSPMILLAEVPMNFTASSINNHIIKNEYIYFNAIGDINGIFRLNKDTLIFENVVSGVANYMISKDDIFMMPFKQTEDYEHVNTVIRFFDVDLLNSDFTFEDHYFEISLNSAFELINMNILDDKLVLLGNKQVFIIDIFDSLNPNIVAEINNDDCIFVSADINEDILYIGTIKGNFLVYNVSNINNPNQIYIEPLEFFHFGIGGIDRLKVVYPYIYHNTGYCLSIYNIENNYQLEHQYGNQGFHMSVNVHENNFYYLFYDITDCKFKFYSVFTENSYLFELEYEFSKDVFTSTFAIQDNILYLSVFSEDDMLNYLKIYQISNNELFLLNTYALNIGNAGFLKVTDNYLLIPSFDGVTVKTYVYQIDGNDMNFVTEFGGVIDSYSGYDSPFIVTHFNNQLTFRNLDNISEVLHEYHVFGNNYSAKIINQSFLSLGDLNSIRMFSYDLFEDLFIQTYQELFPIYKYMNIFNEILTDNAESRDFSKYYNVYNGQITPIGELEDKRCVVASYIYPEYNKMVQFAMSGIHIYDIEYTVSSSDQVVEVSRDTYVYPNPVNGGDVNFKTSISGNDTEISIYNIKGQLVKTSKAFQTKDNQSIFTWDKKNNQNQSVASGVYFYKIKNDTSVKTGKFLIIK